MWLRVLLSVAVGLLVAGMAHAQAPPASFFEGRSNDELRALARDSQSDVLLRRVAATKLVMTLADRGDFDAADAAGREFAKNIDPFALKYVVAARRRSYVHAAALGALGIIFGLALLSLVAAHRLLTGALPAVRRMAPLLTLFLVYTGVVGGLLASRYENGSFLPFVLFATVMSPLLVVFRVWSAVGSRRLEARVGRGALAVAATLALGFLVVEQVDPSYLQGFGL